jgi:hypothetical protein
MAGGDLSPAGGGVAAGRSGAVVLARFRSVDDGATISGHSDLQVLFGKLAKLIGNGPG